MLAKTIILSTVIGTFLKYLYLSLPHGPRRRKNPPKNGFKRLLAEGFKVLLKVFKPMVGHFTIYAVSGIANS